MANFTIPGTQQKTNKEKALEKKYETQLFGQLDNSKTSFNADVDCDMYVVANVPHFKLGNKNGTSNEGYDTVQDCYKAIQYLSKVINDTHIPIKMIVHIAQNLETKKYEIIKTVVKDNPNKK